MPTEYMTSSSPTLWLTCFKDILQYDSQFGLPVSGRAGLEEVAPPQLSVQRTAAV